MRRLVDNLGLKKDWELDGVYAFSNELLFVQFIEPHEGTDFKYMVRADYKLSFNKWGNCFYEVVFLNLEKDLNLIILDIKKMINEKDKILERFTCNNGQVYYDISDYVNETEWKFLNPENYR